MLGGGIPARSALGPKDWRRSSPRFSEANFAANAAGVKLLAELAAAKGVTPAQLALAWVLSRGEDVVAIPGTTNPARLRENVVAATITLTPAEAADIAAAVPEAAGDRYAGLFGTWNAKTPKK
jgi:aryl-alcohol dehydrogenase-like predicted oxidoreductase